MSEPKPIGTAFDAAAWLADIRAQPSHECENPKCTDPAGNRTRFYAAKGGLCYDCGHTTAIERDAQLALQSALHAAIPEHYLGKGLETYQVPPGDGSALRAAHLWAPSSGRSLYFASLTTGTGKTHLAYAIAQREIRAGRSVLTSGAVELLASLRSTYNAPLPGFEFAARPTENAIFGALADADLVVLDDLGANNPTEWAAEVMFRLIDGRVTANRPTILTSNFPVGGLANRIGGEHGRRVASRLAGACQVVQIRASDYRLRG